MRCLIICVTLLGIACIAGAYDLGNRAPVKPTSTYPPNIPVDRQGGDTIASAFVIPEDVVLPWHDTGTTTGYTNDYDAVCPYSGSTSPDVVYRYVPQADIASIDVDLCYSSYDTKVYVYDANLNLVACNDDFYFGAPPECYMYSSKVENVPVIAGQTYYVVIDGYGGSNGAYDMIVSRYVPCEFTCPTPNIPEGEQTLVDGYVDHYDGGCNTPPGYPFRDVGYGDGYGNVTLCGNAGWYVGGNGGDYRDTDWYYLEMGPWGEIDVTVDALQPTYIFELGPQDCSSVDVLQLAVGGPCHEAAMTITGYTWCQIVWFWAGPTTFTSPDGSHPYNYPYTCWFSGLQVCVPTQATTWSTMKALYQ